jgi:hypothetical protein
MGWLYKILFSIDLFFYFFYLFYLFNFGYGINWHMATCIILA